MGAAVAFPSLTEIVALELPIPGTEASATLHVKRVGLRTKEKWAADKHELEQAERQRLAALRKQHTREQWPELYEREQLDGAGKPVLIEADGLFAEDGKPARVPMKIAPAQTAEAARDAMAIARMILGDAVVKLEGLVFGEVDSASVKDPEQILEMLEAAGLYQLALTRTMAVQRPTPKQLF